MFSGGDDFLSRLLAMVRASRAILRSLSALLLCSVGVPGLVTMLRKRMVLSLKEKVEIVKKFKKYP